MEKQTQLIPSIEQIYGTPLGPLKVVLSGSQWLELLGTRRSGDLDLITDELHVSVAEGDNDNEYIKQFGFEAGSIISDPDHHVWLMGIKFIAPWAYRKIMSKRAQPKDLGYLPVFDKALARYDKKFQSVHISGVFSNPSGQSVVANLDAKAPNSPFQSSHFAKTLRSSQIELSQVDRAVFQSRSLPAIGDFGWRVVAFSYRIRHRLPEPMKKTLRWLRKILTGR